MGELFIKIKTKDLATDEDGTKEISVMKFDSNYVWDKTVLDTIDHYLKNDDIIEVKLVK
jgi:hypothetical protein